MPVAELRQLNQGASQPQLRRGDSSGLLQKNLHANLVGSQYDGSRNYNNLMNKSATDIAGGAEVYGLLNA